MSTTIPEDMHLFSPQRFTQISTLEREVSKIGVGLENLGNTCFMSVIIQNLANTDVLLNYIDLGEHTDECTLSNWCSICELHLLLPAILNSAKAVKPNQFFKNFLTLSPTLIKYKQHDCHEFWHCLFMHGQTCLVPKTYQDTGVEETTILHKIFGGYIKSEKQCTICQKISPKYDAFMDLSLDIGDEDDSSISSLRDALNHYTNAELLTKDDKPYCEECEENTTTTKTITLFKLPQILIIHLRRFDYETQQKNSKAISISETLNVTDFCSEAASTVTYTLSGVIVHRGEAGSFLKSGHFLTYIKKNEWYQKNDSKVRNVVSFDDICKEDGYIFFFKINQ